MKMVGFLRENLFFIHVGIIFFLVTACGGGDGTQQYFEDISFEVNDSLIGPAFTDSSLHFTFHPPIGWNQVSDTMMQAALQRLTDEMNKQDSMKVTPLRFFIDSQNGSSCCLSQLTSVDTKEDVPNQIHTYRSLLRAKFPDAKIHEGAFRIDAIKICQFLINDDERVIFKLLCWGPQKQLFQVDYIMSRSIYPLQIRAIESSIGSFKMHPH